MDGTDPRSDGNERVVEASALHRVKGLGDQVEVQEARTDVERDCKRRINVDGVQMDGK